MNNDRISSIAILIVAALVYYSVSGMSMLASYFPKVISVIMGLFALVLLIRSLVHPQIEQWFEEGADFAYVLWVLLGLVVYIVLIPLIGFFLSSILFIIFYSWILGRNRNSRKAIGISAAVGVVTTLSFYIIFKFLFLVPLTQGILFGGD